MRFAPCSVADLAVTAEIPLARSADAIIARLASATGSRKLAGLDGRTLLGERAMLANMKVPGRISAGGGCTLYAARGDTVALNLARAADRELLPALFETDELTTPDIATISAWIARSDATQLVERGRSMGLAIAAEHEQASGVTMALQTITSDSASTAIRRPPRVIDLSALWAGPLAAHLLWLAGADVVKVESRSRPDAMRHGDASFYTLLNQGKASVVLDFADAHDRQALLTLIATADIVIEAARPRALAQLGIHADDILRRAPGLVWITITGHGAVGASADWVGFGDDCAVAAGLSAALHDASGRSGFVGDAIADPLTGMVAALTAWNAWTSSRGGRLGIAMTDVAAHCLALERANDSQALTKDLSAWAAAAGAPFPSVTRRHVGDMSAFGQDTHSCLARYSPC